MRDFLRLGAMVNATIFMTAEDQLAHIRPKVQPPRKPSGKDRTKVKAARKQRRKSRR